MTTKAEDNPGNVTRDLEVGDHETLEKLRRMVVAVNGTSDPDLEQEVFLRVLQAFRRHGDVRSPYGLMRKIVHDTIVDSWRARARYRSGEWEAAQETSQSQIPRFEEQMDRDRAVERLRDAILKLGCDIRGPVYLFYVEGYSTPTIVRVIRKSPSAVRMALHRGRKQLAALLGNPQPTVKN